MRVELGAPASREVPNRAQSLHDRCAVQCEYTMATFSTGERRKRAKGDRKSMETSLVIKQALETAGPGADYAL